MDTHVDFAVIGRGLMGTACARHLAEAGLSVFLIGPDEPTDATCFEGPFASHHDAGRITRHLATDVDWARLSARSIARYADMETRSGVVFYHPVGGMMAAPADGPGKAFGAAMFDVAAKEAIVHDRLEGARLAARFPMFRFTPGSRAALDPVGGWIDPRAMRSAEELLAVAAGARIVPEPAIAHRHGQVGLKSGTTLTARDVIVATGAYAGMDALLPLRPSMKVYGRTVAFVTLSDAEAAALDGMPTLIFMPEGQAHTLYLLPPICYPDGTWRIKIGGEDDSPRLTTPEEVTRWYQGGGDAEAGHRLLDALKTLMPDLPMRDTSTGACAVSFTATGKPFVARLDTRTTLLTGGNGAGAKCADELGRLGALVARGKSLTPEGYSCDFSLRQAVAGR